MPDPEHQGTKPDLSLYERIPQFDRLRTQLKALSAPINSFIAAGNRDSDDSNYHFEKVMEFARNCLLHEPKSPLLGNVLMDESLLNWQNTNYACAIPDEWEFTRIKNAPYQDQWKMAMKNRLTLHNLGELERVYVANAAIETEDINLLRALCFKYPENMDSLVGFKFEKTDPRFQWEACSFLLTLDTERIWPYAVFNAQVVTGDFVGANNTLQKMIEENPYAFELPELAAKIGRPTIGIILLLTCHRNEVKEFSYSWYTVGQATALADSIEANKIGRLLLNGGEKAVKMEEVIFPPGKSTDAEQEQVTALILRGRTNPNQWLIQKDDFDADMAALYYFAGYAEVPHGKEEGLGILRGMIDRFKIKQRSDLISHLAYTFGTLGYPDDAIAALQALSTVDPGEAVQQSYIILEQSAKILPVEKLISLLKFICLQIKRTPALEPTIKSMIESGRTAEAHTFLTEADRIAIEYRRAGFIDDDYGRRGIHGSYFTTLAGYFEQEGNMNALNDLLTHLTEINRGEAGAAYEIAKRMGKFNEALDIALAVAPAIFEQPLFVLGSFLEELSSYMDKGAFRAKIHEIVMAGMERLGEIVKESGGVTLMDIEYSNVSDILAKLMIAGFDINADQSYGILKRTTTGDGKYIHLGRLAAFSPNKEFVNRATRVLKSRNEIYGLICIALGQNNDNLLQETLSMTTFEEVEQFEDVIHAYKWVEDQLTAVFIAKNDTLSQ